MRTVRCTWQQVEDTLSYLKAAGQRRSECVVLWLGQEQNGVIHVQAVYRPAQQAAMDIFRIPPASMRELMNILSSRRWMIAAQVHSHPAEAFHSKADDTWAIVRHQGALSLVVPDFALKTNAQSFRTDTKVFMLDAANRWCELRAFEVGQWLRIQ